jgi:EF hand
MHLPRFPTYALALLVSAGLAAPPARAFDNDKGKKDKHDDKHKDKAKHKGGHDDRDDDRDDNNGGMRFRGMDRNGDGVITRREWNGNDVSFRNHDWNEDGVLSGPEVRPGAERPNDPRPDRDRFRELDRDRNGVITRDEWPGTRAEFDRLDRNHNRELNRNEFSRR